MAIRIKYDAAAVVPPSNQSTRKYGQNLVQQQRQQNFLGQQQGYDRMFQLGRDAIQSRDQAIRQGQQNAANTIRDVNQNASLMERQEAQNKFLLEQQKAEQQNKFMEDARKQSSGVMMDDIKNGNYDPATGRKLQQNLVAESEALGNPNLDATQRAEALAKIRAERALLTANRMEKPPQPTRDEQLKEFLGPNYNTYKDQPWVPDGKGGFAIAKDAQLPQKPPASAEEAFKADPKTEAKFMEEAKLIIGKGKPLEDEAAYGRAVSLARKLWERSQLPSEFGTSGSTSSAAYYNAPDSGVPAAPQAPPAAAQSLAPAGIPVAPPDAGVPPSPPIQGGQQAGSQPTQSQAAWDAIYGAQQAQNPQAAPGMTTGQPAAGLVDAIRGQGPTSGAGQSPIDRGIALAPGHPDYKPLPTPTDKKDEKGYVIMSDGSKVRPEEVKFAVKGMRSDVDYKLHPDGSPIEQSPSVTLLEAGQGRKQHVKVGGKPLAVTPGTLTPQETAARGRIMELPREQRIAALMPYESSLKGKTLEQLLEDPATKAGYAEMTKQGLTTGNYREDMLGRIDDMLQQNVLNAGAKPDAYVGMRADDITDPKAKAEVAKLPRPMSKNDRSAIRSGQLYVDPEGVIRARS